MERGMLEGKKIMITGGTGSFGNAFARFLLENESPERVLILSRDEKKQNDMRIAFNHPKLDFVIADVRDRDTVFTAMRGVDMVFHAAALKQVPSCEFFPMEAVRTNVMGAGNVLDAAEFHGVQKVVVLSTDKAVYPINAMGISKALMEKVMMAKARSTETSTAYCGVRYGNVMYSRGSVIPLFVSQIREGKPLTVTHPQMTRFLLPLKEAVELVLFALMNGESGEVFVRKSPASTVGDLAEACQNVFGVKGKVKTIGIREGEKLHETLLTREELMNSEEFDDYYRMRGERGFDYDDFFTRGHGEQFPSEGYTSENTVRLSVKEIEALLMSTPEIKAELEG
jgi:UDP-glucose 4-epimerase